MLQPQIAAGIPLINWVHLSTHSKRNSNSSPLIALAAYCGDRNEPCPLTYLPHPMKVRRPQPTSEVLRKHWLLTHPCRSTSTKAAQHPCPMRTAYLCAPSAFMIREPATALARLPLSLSRSPGSRQSPPKQGFASSLPISTHLHA